MSSKRGPSVLVTDTRERSPGRSQRRSVASSSSAGSNSEATSSGSQRHGRISVDNVLRNATAIPSGQPRAPPGPLRLLPTNALSAAAAAARRRGLTRRSSSFGAAGVSDAAGQPAGASGSQGLGMLASGVLPSLSRTAVPNMPLRTTKISEKLVLLPEAIDDDDEDDDDVDDWDVAGENAVAARRAMHRARFEQGNGLYDGERPPRDEELDVLRKRGGIRGKSYAERLPKGQRTEKVARLTAYCTAQAFKMRATADFLRAHHEAKTKLYDDCLYTVYHLPLLKRSDGLRIRSRPILKTPGTGKTVLDLEIERSELRDEHMGYDDEYGSHANGEHVPGMGPHGETIIERIHHDQEDYTRQDDDGQPATDGDGSHSQDHDNNDDDYAPKIVSRLETDAKNFAEMFVFSYGVVVFWNFTEQQEKGILADLAFAENLEATDGIPLAMRPLDEGDVETEEFHFEYSDSVKRPRVFNDMITLLPRSDHMVKLTISHAIAQSTKLCFFEEKMSETMLNAQNVPKNLALTGQLNMSRTEIVKILGRLFKNRVDINLSSNILDVPNFFWDSEPTLHPLYVAIREYLEIDQRIQVLNERCRVFLDLAEILADSVAHNNMSTITWIVIVLIVISIGITVTEVTIRFGIMTKEKRRDDISNATSSTGAGFLDSASTAAVQPPWLELRADRRNMKWTAEDGTVVTLDDLRTWGAQLGTQEKAAACGSEIVGQTFAGV